MTRVGMEYNKDLYKGFIALTKNQVNEKWVGFYSPAEIGRYCHLHMAVTHLNSHLQRGNLPGVSSVRQSFPRYMPYRHRREAVVLLYSFFNPSTRWRVGGQRHAPEPTVQEAGWVPRQVWKGTEKIKSRNIICSFRPAASRRAVYAIPAPCVKRSYSLFSVLRQVHRLFQSEFSTECDLVLLLSTSRISLLLLPRLPITSILPSIFPSFNNVPKRQIMCNI